MRVRSVSAAHDPSRRASAGGGTHELAIGSTTGMPELAGDIAFDRSHLFEPDGAISPEAVPIGGITSTDAYVADLVETAGRTRSADHAPLRSQRPRATRLRWLPPVAALAAAACFFAASASGPLTRRDLPFNIEGFLVELGLGIDEVRVRGHRRTLEQVIFDAIDLPAIRSELSLDTRAIERRLARLPWVERATVTRRAPNALDIVIRERTAAAILVAADGRHTLVDIDGRVLGPAASNGESAGTGLLRIQGEGAASEVKRLRTLLSRHIGLAAQLDRAERIAGRRWTLHLIGGLDVLLPADPDGDRDAEALDEVMAGLPGQRLIDRPVAVIDARVTGRLVLRPKTAAAVDGPRPIETGGAR